MHIPVKSDGVNNVCRVANDIIGENNIRYVFEFGSRYGEDTAQFAERYPGATVFGFECNPNTVEECRKNLSIYSNVVFSERAVTDAVGERVFYPIDKEHTITTWKDGNQGASSLFKASGKYPVEHYAQTSISVKTTTLKAVMEEHGVPRIDILWMDVQGAELLALTGLGERISDVRVIFTEVEFFEIYAGQPFFDDIKRMLDEKGFIFAGFLRRGAYAADALFVNSRCADATSCDFAKYGFALFADEATETGGECSILTFIFKKLLSRWSRG